MITPASTFSCIAQSPLIAAMATAALSVALACSGVSAQMFSKPAEQPAPASGQPATPVTTPGAAPAAAPGEQEFPGPRGSKIKFPTGLYDEAANVSEVLSAARQRAVRDNKRVLIMWGENRCGFCVFLDDVFKTDSKVKPIVLGEYELVKVNIGKSFMENKAFLDQYAVDFFSNKIPNPSKPGEMRQIGAPALTVVDPKADRAIDTIGGNQMLAAAMSMERVFDENKIAEFLLNHRAPASVAQTSLNNALADAKKDGKPVLAVFVSPGCEDCDRLWNWTTNTSSGRALSTGVVPVKIDTQRMIGGLQMLSRVVGGSAAAAPFVALLDAEGNSIAPDAMIATWPRTDGERTQVDQLLSKHAPKLSAADRVIVMEGLKPRAAESVAPMPAVGK